MKRSILLSITGIAMSFGIIAPTMAHAAVRYPQSKMNILLNGSSVSSPADIVVKQGKTPTTFVPIWYLMNALNKLGVQNSWDGHDWHMTLPSNLQPTVNLHALSAGFGKNEMIVNGVDVQKVTSVIYVDPSTHKNTTYFPIYYVMKVLKDVGVQSQWDGHDWRMTGATPSSNVSTSNVPHPTISSIVWPSSSVTVSNNGTTVGSTTASGNSVSSQYWPQTQNAINGVQSWNWTPYENMNAFEIKGTFSSKGQMDQIIAFMKEENGQWVWNGIMDNQTTFQVSGTGQSTQIEETHNDVTYFATPK